MKLCIRGRPIIKCYLCLYFAYSVLIFQDLLKATGVGAKIPSVLWLDKQICLILKMDSLDFTAVIRVVENIHTA